MVNDKGNVAATRLSQPPDFHEINPGHFVACHYADEIELPGISLK